MNKPLISVIMPVHNSEEFVADAIKSILSQTYTNFEFIIINDGSNDNTLAIIQQFKDERIKLVSHSINKGNYVCRNEGCKISKGEYICVMDADDIATPNRIKKQLFIMEKDESLLACGSYFKFIGGSICIKPRCYEFIRLSLLRNNVFLHSSLMMKRSILEEIGYYNESYCYSSDYDLVCKIALKGKIENIPDILMEYRIHGKQISSAKKIEQMMYANEIRLEYLNTLGFHILDEEDIFFTKMMTSNNRISNTDIESINNMNDKLLGINKSSQVFDQIILEKYLNRILSECYLRKI